MKLTKYLCAKRCTLLAFAFLLCTHTVFAQEYILRKFKGTVVDEKGKPIEGVTVKVDKSTAQATSTGEDGSFVIKYNTDKTVVDVKFSSVSYEPKIVKVEEGVPAKVVLKSLMKDMTEVIVVDIGLGQKAKAKDLSTSQVSVNMEDVMKAPVPNIGDALSGRVAGLQVESPDGQPGSTPSIVIRGVGSATQSTDPLYVIDGFPQESPDLNSINPAEIESFVVLKDAAATAKYGAQGANGVILITTKRGKAPVPVLTFNPSVGVETRLKKVALMNPYQFVQLQYDINPSYADQEYLIAPNDYPAFSSPLLSNGARAALEEAGIQRYKNVKGVDWQDLTERPAPYQNYLLSLSGRTDFSNYLLSASYTDQEGILLNSGYKRAQARFSLGQKLNDQLSMGLNVNYAHTLAFGQIPSVPNTPDGTSNFGGRGFSFMENMWMYRPISGIAGLSSSNTPADSANGLDFNGDPSIVGGPYNPVMSLLNEINNRYSNNVTAGCFFNYKIFTKDRSNLSFKTTLGSNLTFLDNEILHNSNTYSGSQLTSSGLANGPNGSLTHMLNSSYTCDNAFNYINRFDARNMLDIVGGVLFGQTGSKGTSITTHFIPNETLPPAAAIGQGTLYSTSSSYATSSNASFYVSGNYKLNEKYLFTASIRRDGSSRFPVNKWGTFPAGSVAWKIGDENFMSRIKWMSDEKIRYSVGVTGNNRVPNGVYPNTTSGAYYSFNNNVINGLYPNVMPNPTLKWETGIQNNLGFNFTLFSRIDFTIDAYKKVTKNMLYYATLPVATGYTNVYENIGSVQNTGLEFSFLSQNINAKDFRWTTSFNISFNKNRVLALTDNETARISGTSYNGTLPAPYITKVGQPVFRYYGYIFDGLYQYSDFNYIRGQYVLKDNIPSYGNLTANNIYSNVSRSLYVNPGWAKFKDLNGDGVINPNDYTTIGTPYPIHFGGLTNNFNYKGFSVNVFFQWSVGAQILNANRIKMEGFDASGVSYGSSNGGGGFQDQNQFATYAAHWSVENPNTNYYQSVNTGATGIRNYTSRIVEDGSYLRFKTLSIAYSIPTRLVRKCGFRTASLFFSVNNLKTWTKYSGPDPEVHTFGPGYDYSPYPRVKTVALGANISL